MKSITIHKLDDLLAERLEARARETGESLNATVKSLLEISLGIERGTDTQRGYRRFLGTWSAAEATVFEETIADCGTIDAADWQA